MGDIKDRFWNKGLFRLDEAPPRPPKGFGNRFHDPYNLGLYGGAMVGLFWGFVFAAKVVPWMRTGGQAMHVGPVKLMLLVRQDLNMSKGKVAAQCSHGAVSAYEGLNTAYQKMYRNRGLLASWAYNGQPKIVVSVPNLKALEEVLKEARAEGVQVREIVDAGMTEVPPNTTTVAALGPSPCSILDRITGNLKLLK